MIAALAAVTAIGTAGTQRLEGAEDTVQFVEVITQVGVTFTNNAVFTCPSDAFYLVHYRVTERSISASPTPACTVALFVGQEIIEVARFFQVEHFAVADKGLTCYVAVVALDFT